ncbi:type I-E CRISPR-associated protein Cas6/Cse3/CasE [Trueperella pyogenes]|uniref:type I-E CRISPR-associated protein Cas6/Cse3/CasE n=1 Tax=Trueperella pyogenes TaxID=1661 RepID=UPI0032535DD8
MSETVFLSKYPVHLALKRPHLYKGSNGWQLNDPVFRHRAVMGLFGEFSEKNPRAEHDILFRLDLVPGQAPFFLVQSKTCPAGEGDLAGLVVKEVAVPEIPVGESVRFRVAVNAVRRKGTGGISPVSMDAGEQGENSISRWLSQKLASGLTEVSIVNHTRELLGADRRGKAPNSSHVVQVDTIDGVAKVASSEGLQKLILHGVGRAKSYGCGLLSVRALG